MLLSLLFLFPHSYSHHHTLSIFKYSKLKPMPHLSQTPVIQPSRRVSDLNMDISLQYHPPNKLHKTNRLSLKVISEDNFSTINNYSNFLFQAYGVTNHQSVQELGYKQTSFVSVGDPGRYSQGINTVQELIWILQQLLQVLLSRFNPLA